MQRFKLSLFFLCFFNVVILAADKPVTLVINAEDFQCHANWWQTSDSRVLGGEILQARGGEGDALAAINVKTAGTYQLWTRAKDYVNNQPKTRRFLLVVDDVTVDIESGQHGEEGWKWEHVGQRTLDAGTHVLGLRDSAKFYGRCDAVLLTTDALLDPNAMKLSQFKRDTIKPLEMPLSYPDQREQSVVQVNEQGKTLAAMENERTRLSFVLVHDQQGKPLIVRKTAVKVDGQWIDSPISSAAENVFVLYQPDAKVDLGSFYPAWPGQSPVVQMQVGDHAYTTRGNNQNPFAAGERTDFLPRVIKSSAAHAVEVIYQSAGGSELVARWELDTQQSEAVVTFKFTPENRGNYSIGFTAFTPWQTDAIAFNQLSPMVQFVRREPYPLMTTSSCSPLPMAMVEPMAKTGMKWTYALIADPDHLATNWPSAQNARLGLSLLNSQAQVQPTAFGPILGFDDSSFEAGQHVVMCCRVLVSAGDWKSAQQYAMRHVFEVSDYRKPVAASLSQAYLNMVDLMGAREGGWDDKLMAFYNIESPATVTHASPLGIVEAALLTEDETFFKERALPTIAYTLSRPSAHFAAKVPDDMHVYVNEQRITLTVPSAFYGAAYWQGLHDLLGRRNAWLDQMIFGKGLVQYANSYSTIPVWSELLANYRQHPDGQLLSKIIKEADQFLVDEVYARRTDTQNIRRFYNISFYPYWWDLQDLYDLTGEQRYLDAAIEGANFTMAGQWAHPKPQQQSRTIHRNNQFGHGMTVWWLGDQRFRLGYPIKDGAIREKQVPGWEVSPTGLGFEQPTTLYAVGKGEGLGMILMSAWAPNLLRLYGNTGNDLYRSYARNSIIGRFANYPGYYVRGETDLYQAADYAYTGPDVTSLYYHHVPPQAAFTMDYLVTQAKVRSQGQIDFPWSRQQGYVWFTNRIYGQAPGRVLEDEAVTLSLTRKPISVAGPNVDYLLGQSSKATYVILMNQLHEALDAQVSVDVDADNLAFGKRVDVIDPLTKVIIQQPLKAKMTVALQPMGLTVLRIGHVKEQAGLFSKDLPLLKQGHVTMDLPEPWKQVHAFRIRSPFGHDGLYVVLMGHPAEGASAKLVFDAVSDVRPAMTSTDFPHEFLLYPLEMSQDIRFHLTLTDDKQQRIDTPILTLFGRDGLASPGLVP